MEFADKHNLTDFETQSLLRAIEKEGLEVVKLEDLDTHAEIDDLSKKKAAAVV